MSLNRYKFGLTQFKDQWLRVLTARAIIPVTMPTLTATIMYGDEKVKLVNDGGFSPFFRYPICTKIYKITHRN